MPWRVFKVRATYRAPMFATYLLLTPLIFDGFARFLCASKLDYKSKNPVNSTFTGFLLVPQTGIKLCDYMRICALFCYLPAPYCYDPTLIQSSASITPVTGRRLRFW